MLEPTPSPSQGMWRQSWYIGLSQAEGWCYATSLSGQTTCGPDWCTRAALPQQPNQNWTKQKQIVALPSLLLPLSFCLVITLSFPKSMSMLGCFGLRVQKKGGERIFGTSRGAMLGRRRWTELGSSDAETILGFLLLCYNS